VSRVYEFLLYHTETQQTVTACGLYYIPVDTKFCNEWRVLLHNSHTLRLGFISTWQVLSLFLFLVGGGGGLVGYSCFWRSEVTSLCINNLVVFYRLGFIFQFSQLFHKLHRNHLRVLTAFAHKAALRILHFTVFMCIQLFVWGFIEWYCTHSVVSSCICLAIPDNGVGDCS
jgi:hypothetical protein